MKVILSDNVLGCIDDYETYLREKLKLYEDTIYELVDGMKESLYALKDESYHTLCSNKSLGQRFDEKGKPIFKNLKKVILKNHWAFSYIVDYPNDTIWVIRMLHEAMITSCQQDIYKPFRIGLLRLQDNHKTVIVTKQNIRYPFLTGLMNYRARHKELF